MIKETKAKASMGFWRSWALVVGMMIGSGIFMMPAILAPFGGIGLMSIIFVGGGTFLIALMLSRLARSIPKVGGPYAYVREGLGDFAAFLTMWGYSVSIWTGIAAVAVALVGYVDVFIPGLAGNTLSSLLVSLSVIWLLVALNIHGVREASIIQLVTTLLKLLPLIVIGGLGFFYAFSSGENSLPEMNPMGGSPLTVLNAAAILTMFAFLGVEGATIPADDVIEPEKTIPRVTFWATITVTLVYLVATLGVMLVVPAEILETSTSPFSDAASALMGPVGAKFIAVGAIISMVGALNALTLVGAQTPMAAARDGLFPSRFAKLSKNGTAAFSLIILGLITSLLLVMNYTKGLRGAFEFLLLISTLSLLIPFAFSAISEMVLHKRQGNRVPLRTKILSFSAFIYSVWLIIGSGHETVFWGFILLLAGMPVYAWLNIHKKEKIQTESSE